MCPLWYAVRKLLCNHGEAPMSSKEWADFCEAADPRGSGSISSKAFRALPCWQAPDLTRLPSSPAKRSEGGGSGLPSLPDAPPS